MAGKLPRNIFRKKLILGIILILIAVAGYFGYERLTKDNNTIRYVTAAVERGTLIVSVSGSGQVSVADQVEVKPKVAGEIIYAGIKSGKEVKAGTLLAQIDTSGAEKAVRDAETALETAKLELEKLLSPPDELTLLQAENSLIQAKESKQKAEDNLKKAYEDGFNVVANVFLELPAIMAGLKDILFSYNFSVSQQNIDYYGDAVKIYDEKVLKYKIDAYNKYQTARRSYELNFEAYKSASRFSETETIESLINETYETVKNIAETIKSTNNLIQFYQDKLIERNLRPATVSNTHLSALNSYTGKTNSQLLNLLSSQKSFQDNKKSIIDAERTITEKELSLAKLEAGADELTIRAKKIAIQQKEDALSTARQELNDCYIYTPFDGLVAKVGIKKGDSVSTGTTIATIITKQKIAETSLNEIDAAKVKVGQKATFNFDAVEELVITGEVIEIDTLGTVSQGVVTYNVKIAFDTEDERIKPGMSLSAAIITEAKQNVLIIPNSAIKYQGDVEYVQVMRGDDRATLQEVEVGISNDTQTEIISGLNEGAKVVTQTTGSSQPLSSSQSQGFNSRGGGEFMRIMR